MNTETSSAAAIPAANCFQSARLARLFNAKRVALAVPEADEAGAVAFAARLPDLDAELLELRDCAVEILGDEVGNRAKADVLGLCFRRVQIHAATHFVVAQGRVV